MKRTVMEIRKTKYKKGPFLARERALEHINEYDMPSYLVQLITLIDSIQGVWIWLVEECFQKKSLKAVSF